VSHQKDKSLFPAIYILVLPKALWQLLYIPMALIFLLSEEYHLFQDTRNPNINTFVAVIEFKAIIDIRKHMQRFAFSLKRVKHVSA